MRGAVFFALLVFVLPARADKAPAKPLARLVLVGGLDAQTALRGAQEAGGARWGVMRLEPRLAPSGPKPAAQLKRLRQLYLEADFVGCLAHMQRPALALDDLLARGQREAAAQTAILGAACAHDAGDADLAKRLLSRVLVAEFATTALAETKPAVQKLMETMQAARRNEARVPLVLKTHPAGAEVSIDGQSMGCAKTPCKATLRKGRHLVVLRKLGHLSRRLVIELDERLERKISLDPAPAKEARVQLANHLAAGHALDGVEVAATAAEAAEARVVLLVQSKQRQLRASLFDRKLRRIVSRASLPEEPGALARGVRAVIEEWREAVEPTPLWKRPLFWGITVGAAAATAVTVFFLTRPTEKHYVLEVPAK